MSKSRYPPAVESDFDDLLTALSRESAVVGVLIGGGRGKGLATEHSDWDVYVFVQDESEDLRNLLSEAPDHIEICSVLTLEEFSRSEEEGGPPGLEPLQLRASSTGAGPYRRGVAARVHCEGVLAGRGGASTRGGLARRLPQLPLPLVQEPPGRQPCGRDARFA